MTGTMSLFDADGAAAQPRVRTNDPDTSRQARARSQPGNGDKIKAIRQYVFDHGASTAWEIADGVARLYPGRCWDHAGIRSACNPKRSGLFMFPGGEKEDHAGRVRPVMLYALQAHVVAVRNGAL